MYIYISVGRFNTLGSDFAKRARLFSTLKPLPSAPQAKSKGLLEVTVLVSGDQRRRNIPGAAFKKGKRFLAAISPVVSSPSSSVVAQPAGRYGHRRRRLCCARKAALGLLGALLCFVLCLSCSTINAGVFRRL